MVFPPLAVADSRYLLTAEQWAVPRQVDSLLHMPAIASAMQEIRTYPGSRLIIRYPGGDEGTLWAYELRGWLISLGLSSQDIELLPGSGMPRSIELEVQLPVQQTTPGEAAESSTPNRHSGVQ